jgi:hypothetical protein
MRQAIDARPAIFPEPREVPLENCASSVGAISAETNIPAHASGIINNSELLEPTQPLGTIRTFDFNTRVKECNAAHRFDARFIGPRLALNEVSPSQPPGGGRGRSRALSSASSSVVTTRRRRFWVSCELVYGDSANHEPPAINLIGSTARAFLLLPTDTFANLGPPLSLSLPALTPPLSPPPLLRPFAALSLTSGQSSETRCPDVCACACACASVPLCLCASLRPCVCVCASSTVCPCTQNFEGHCSRALFLFCIRRAYLIGRSILVFLFYQLLLKARGKNARKLYRENNQFQ